MRYLLGLLAMVLAIKSADANDLKDLYELALTRDASLRAAGFQRDAAIEARPQALAQWLPQVSASASATRERVGFDAAAQSTGSQAVNRQPGSQRSARLNRQPGGQRQARASRG